MCETVDQHYYVESNFNIFFSESVLDVMCLFFILIPIINFQQTYFKYEICQHAQFQCFLTCFYHQRIVANVLSIYNKHDHNIYLTGVNKDALFVHLGGSARGGPPLPAPFKIWPSAPRSLSFLYHCSSN